ncbi:hypothetical protein ACQKDD_16605 [Planococcus kocurii]|uniref:hypothetical protein n=1 Tax=Planococcus kocurii TaxID=1374 RepID=UPI003CFC2CD8
MAEHNKAWFLLSFASLDFENQVEVERFLEKWRLQKPKFVATMIGYAVGSSNGNVEEHEIQSNAYYPFDSSTDSEPFWHQSVPEALSSMSDISMFYKTIEIPIERDVGIVKNNANKLKRFQDIIKEYLNELFEVQKIRDKYDKKAAERFNFLKETEPTEFKAFQKEFPYFFHNANPDRIITKRYGHGELPIAKPFGNKTDEFLKILPNLYRQFEQVTLASDGKFYLKPVMNPQTFELSVYAELYEYFQRNSYPVICSECKKYIDNPSTQQLTRFQQEKVVLHKADKRTMDLNFPARSRENQSECELEYYRKKDQKRNYNKKIKLKGDV